MMYKYVRSFIWSFIYPCRITFPLLGKNYKVFNCFLVPVGLFVLVILNSPLVSAVLLSMLSSIAPCSSSLFGCLSACSCFFTSMSFVFTHNMSSFSIVSSSASAGDVRSITLFVELGLCFGLIACINCTQYLYSGVFFRKPHFLYQRF